MLSSFCRALSDSAAIMDLLPALLLNLYAG
jgi:hypothetical protein